MQSAMKGSPIVDPSQPQKPEQTAAQKNPLENEPPSFTAVERKPGQLTRSLELACRCAKTADELKGGEPFGDRAEIGRRCGFEIGGDRTWSVGSRAMAEV